MNIKNIPVEFYNTEKANKPHPIARTVKELKDLLDMLPDDLILTQSGWSDGFELSVPNMSTSPFLDIRENDQ